MDILLSIITINLNNSIGLRKTIESVLSQSFQNYEFIIIDGGSNDGSNVVINENKDRIDFNISEKDNGIYDAQNKGIEQAKGKYILFLNSGDVLVSNDTLKNAFDYQFTEDIVYGDIIYEKDGIEKRKRIFPDILTTYFMLVDVIGHQVQFIKRLLFLDYGLYDTQYSVVADYEFFIRVILKHKASTRHLPIPVATFNLNGFSSSPDQIKRINKERHEIQKKYFSPALVFLYHSYFNLLNSKFYQFSAVRITLKTIRNLIFKFIKK